MRRAKGEKRSSIRLGKWVAGLVVVCVAGLGGWQMGKRAWDGRTRYTVLRVDTLTIESFDPEIGEGIRMTIPETLMVDSAAGRGEWLAKALPELAKKFGYGWVADSVGWHLEIPITTTDADWSIRDRLAWWSESRKVRWTSVDMEDRGWVREMRAPDGVQVLGMAVTWNGATKRWFRSAALASEELDVRIVNTTNLTGLGRKVGSVVENSGMRVVMVDSQEENEGNCTIEGVAGIQKTVGVQFLRSYFGCEWRENSGNGVEDISLILGKRFGERWTGEK